MDGHSVKSTRSHYLLRSKTKSPFDDLEDSLLIEVFCRIPCTKSLIRCIGVSKRWFKVIKQAYFVRRRLSHHLVCSGSSYSREQNFTIIIKNYTRVSWKHLYTPCGFKLNFLPRHQKQVEIVSSCKDLLLCGHQYSQNPDQYSELYICNPFTKQYFVVPGKPVHVFTRYMQWGFVSDFSYLEEKVELWYKVVCLYYNDIIDTVCAIMVTSETRCWSKPIELDSRHWPIEKPFVFNSKLHWPVSGGIDLPGKILVFGSHSMEERNLIDCPKFEKPRGFQLVIRRCGIQRPQGPNLVCTRSFGSCRGLLRMLVVITSPYIIEHRHLAHLEIWELENSETNKWNLLHKIYFDTMTSRSSWFKDDAKEGSLDHVNAIGVHQYDENVVFMTISRRVVLFNILTREVIDIGKSEDFRPAAFPLVLSGWPTLLKSR